MKERERNLRLRAAILEVVENQLKEKNPPEPHRTYERLMQEGYSEDESKRLIGCVVTSEIFDVLEEMEPFNHKRFVEALNKLPEMPWE